VDSPSEWFRPAQKRRQHIRLLLLPATEVAVGLYPLTFDLKNIATEATEFTEKKLQIAKCTLQIENCWKHLFLNVTFAIVILQFAISSL
jgi:hypothetical protein